MATWMSNWTLTESASPLMEELTIFHDHSMTIMFMIMMMVSGFMINTILNPFSNRSHSEIEVLETTWTIMPGLVLIFIAMPSIQLLYMLENEHEIHLTCKAIGNQWFWSYEYPNYGFGFDSYMIPTSELENEEFRLLDVDNRVVLPQGVNIRMLLTSKDVIHAWAVPSLGVKLDAYPGRLNQILLHMTRTGLFYGQCSEICGANHSFMPIVVESVPGPSFLNWTNTAKMAHQ